VTLLDQPPAPIPAGFAPKAAKTSRPRAVLTVTLAGGKQ